MKNGQKYAKEIQKMMNQDYYECSLWSVRNGKKASEECCHVPESFDPVSGSDEFCKKCLGESLEWLNEEYKEPILDDVEKEYLSAVIKPFRKMIAYIVKAQDFDDGKQCIRIILQNGDGMHFPYLDDDAMYKGMEVNKEYSLEELGL
jgi:hypothetical protein